MTNLHNKMVYVMLAVIVFMELLHQNFQLEIHMGIAKENSVLVFVVKQMYLKVYII